MAPAHDSHGAKDTPQNEAKGRPKKDLKAIALQSNAQSTAHITAKASGYNAETLLQIAFSEGVKVRQDKALTDLLYLLDVDSPIPLEALNAVALILEQVYLENERRQQANLKSSDRTGAAVCVPEPEDQVIITKTDDDKIIDLPSFSESSDPKRPAALPRPAPPSRKKS